MYSVGNCLRAPIRRLLDLSVFCIEAQGVISHQALRVRHATSHSISGFQHIPARDSIPTSADCGGSKSPRSACTATSKRVAPKAFTKAPVRLSMRSCPSLLMRKPAMEIHPKKLLPCRTGHASSVPYNLKASASRDWSLCEVHRDRHGSNELYVKLT